MSADDQISAARIRDNVAAIRERIANAAGKGGRRGDDVTLVGVTKYVDAALTAAVAEAGVQDLGESRPQGLLQKHEAISPKLPNLRWHLIGSLQRNKARRIIQVAALIQSADRWKLVQFLDELANQEQLPSIDVLLEVNVSGDENKHGLAPSELPSIVERLASTPRICVQGLMAMGGRGSHESALRQQFGLLRQLREDCQLAAPPNAPLTDLSMGMSGDFELAIEEGATIVRVGSSLFEGVER